MSTGANSCLNHDWDGQEDIVGVDKADGEPGVAGKDAVHGSLPRTHKSASAADLAAAHEEAGLRTAKQQCRHAAGM